ncbi:MAG: M28 family peptidase [Bacteroidales bacterium]
MEHSKIGIVLLALFMLGSCGECGKEEPAEPSPKKSRKKETVNVPEFNADSAYVYIEEQVAFGPRVPGTSAHSACADWLARKLSSFADSLIVQKFSAQIYNGQTKAGKNIIGVFNPEKRRRVLLCAHWDSRPFADQEEDKALVNTPIDGANDGASGVGVLMEIARNLKRKPINIGVDIIFFDLEDYGEPQGEQSRKENSWALGSQHWSKNPHTFNYSANYGILLDMVGVENAQFLREGTSEYFASDILDKVWRQAQQLNYSDYFKNRRAGSITHDHLYINQILGIPTINIIALEPAGNSIFFEHWHTLEDNMENIDKKALKASGSTVSHVIYNE